MHNSSFSSILIGENRVCKKEKSLSSLFVFRTMIKQTASYVGGHQGVETKLLDWNTELGKFTFVSLNHVGMCLSDFLKLILNLTNGEVL